jgi:hypothetical protein
VARKPLESSKKQGKDLGRLTVYCLPRFRINCGEVSVDTLLGDSSEQGGASVSSGDESEVCVNAQSHYRGPDGSPTALMVSKCRRA